ncbi:hypothetical protein EVG20_g4164 [Dentipellis fragilis]|uniref:Uncharacterized protein n=1 Tax=Dentipellis fragilis TaxID=205917 RepID=A0A4Y9YYS2_9AGAM|nr:hypothetical protein EVG20_g4164 [Dentipellis fragilis]
MYGDYVHPEWLSPWAQKARVALKAEAALRQLGDPFGSSPSVQAARQAESQARSTFAIRDDEAWRVSCEEIHQWHLAVLARSRQGYGICPEAIPGHYDYKDPGEESDKGNEPPSKRPRVVSRITDCPPEATSDVSAP